MDVLKTASEFAASRKYFSGSLGFVPTMGALHEGHLSLVRQSKAETEKTVCSIFVNPIQFNNPDDFDKYPNTLDRDLALLEKEGCDFVFAPSSNEMYPEAPQLKFHFGLLEKVMEGAFRPGHFSGVGIVVAKLLHIVQPTVSYFGQKDLQQTLVIKQLVADLGFSTQLRIIDTLREADGLAMSSRNVRLSAEARIKASILYAEMVVAKNRILAGEPFISVLILAKHAINAAKGIKLEYLEVVNASTLLPISNDYTGEAAICVAAYFGDVRLIDNIIFNKHL